jgi:hypothetical protein
MIKRLDETMDKDRRLHRLVAKFGLIEKAAFSGRRQLREKSE